MRKTRATSRAERLVTRRQSRGVVRERIRTAINNYPKAVPQALTPAPLQRKECFGGGVICPSGAMREDSLRMDEWGGQL
jgi:hypothetical protein